MRVWIDLANAPHVAFFLPMIRLLESRGHEVIVSMRDFNNTVELACRAGLQGTVIGEHGGASAAGKMANLLHRAFDLAAFARRAGAQIAVSHNSYTQTIAGRLIGARVVTAMDYEGQPANHIAFRLAHRVIVPACFPASALRRFGCREDKVVRYEGFKEQVYLSDFAPDPGFDASLRRACGLPRGWNRRNTILVTVRAPAEQAAYHHFKNRLFVTMLDHLRGMAGITVVLLPRDEAQRAVYTTRYPRFHVPRAPLSGNDLVYASDLVVSAGGTMNREAAVLGTPACTIFAGALSAVDRALIGLGRLVSIETERDLDRLPLEKKNGRRALVNPHLCGRITDWVLEES